MQRQPAFAGLRDAIKRKSHSMKFLSLMKAVAPWDRLLDLIEPH